MASQSAEWTNAARLVRRTGFGATGAMVDATVRAGAPAQVAAMMAADPDRDVGALSTPAPRFDAIAPVGEAAPAADRKRRNRQLKTQLVQLTAWWLRRMVAVEQPFGEKLTMCWHNHFATSASKVRQASWMAAQNQTLRSLGRGTFSSLASAMLTDAALLDWLDGQKNVATAPNENLSREFMELFSLGHGNGYTENDVREGARALTGWRIRSDGSTVLDPRRHDNGNKTFLGVTGNLDAGGYCQAVLARPAGSSYVAARWWRQLVSDGAPPAPALERVTAAAGPQRRLDAMFTAMLTAPEFGAAQATLIISPIEWLIGAVRALKVPVTDDKTANKLASVLRQLGQLPFYPPSVGGWPSGAAWLSTAAVDGRSRTATWLTTAADLSVIDQAGVTDRLDAVGYLLGIGHWSDRTVQVLKPAQANSAQLAAIALNSPEYLVH